MSTRFENTIRFGKPEQTCTPQAGGCKFGKCFTDVLRVPGRVNANMSPERRYALSVITQHSAVGGIPLAICVENDGQIVFHFADTDEVITDNDVLKELRRFPQVKELMALALNQQAETRREIEDSSDRATRSYVDLYKRAPRVQTREAAEELLANMEPETYVRREFPTPYPEDGKIEQELFKIAQARATGLFRKRKIQKYMDENREKYARAVLRKWYDELTAFEAIEKETENAFNKEHRHVFEEEKRVLENALNCTDPAAAIQEWLASLDLGFEAEAGILVKDRTVYIDLDLPEIEDLPKNEIKRLKSGEIKTVEKTQKQLREEYVSCVLGLALYIAASVLSLSYEIDKVDISGFTQRRNDQGDMIDTYLYSIRIPREKMLGMTIDNPVTCFEHFENRMKLSASNNTFSTIVPYDSPED